MAMEFFVDFLKTLIGVIVILIGFAALVAPLALVVWAIISPWWLVVYLPIIALFITVEEYNDGF